MEALKFAEEWYSDRKPGYKNNMRINNMATQIQRYFVQRERIPNIKDTKMIDELITILENNLKTSLDNDDNSSGYGDAQHRMGLRNALYLAKQVKDNNKESVSVNLEVVDFPSTNGWYFNYTYGEPETFKPVKVNDDDTVSINGFDDDYLLEDYIDDCSDGMMIWIKITHNIPSTSNNIPNKSGVYWVYRTGFKKEAMIVEFDKDTQTYKSIGDNMVYPVSPLKGKIWEEVNKVNGEDNE